LPRQARIIKAHLEVDEFRERNRVRPRQRLALPSPRPAVAAIAITVIEVQAGVRSPWHLERVSHYSLWPVWDHFAGPAPPDPTATAARPLAVVIQELTPGLVDATVIVQFAGAVEPLALTLDGARGWWELMELECPTDIIPGQLLDPPDQTAPTVGQPSDPPLMRGTPARPAGISLPWPGRWPPPELSRPPDPFDSPGIDLG
jgi:Family of unknown function (DUF6459)